LGWHLIERQAHGLNSGVLLDLGQKTVALSFSGLSVFEIPYFEDARDFRDPWYPGERATAGKWLEYQWSIYRVVELYRFVAGAAKCFDPNEALVFEINVNELDGRRLATENADVRMGVMDDPAIEQTFTRRQEVVAAEFTGNWRELCADVLEAFLFLYHKNITRKIILDWMHKASG